MIGVVLAAHVWATCRALPPSAIWDFPVLAHDDYGVHSHRAHVFREALRSTGDTWGCDPCVGCGIVLQPTQEVGSAIYDVGALLFPRAETGRLITAMTWCAILVAPLLLAGAARLLQFDSEQIAWVLLIEVGILWLTPAHTALLVFGMVAFFLASYLCLFVLALYEWFLRRPTTVRYLGVVLGASLLFLVHPFGPLAIALGVGWLILAQPAVRWTWRVAAILTPLPVAALNAFWLVPVLKGVHAPPPPWLTGLNLTLPYWNWRGWGDLLAQLASPFTAGMALLLVFSALTLVGIGRQRSVATAIALGLTLLVNLLLYLGGSFWAPTRFLQSIRFVAVFLNLGALLTGYSLAILLRRLRLPRFAPAAAYVGVGAALVAGVGFFGIHLANRPDAVGLIDFVQHGTVAGDRVMLEAAGPYPWVGRGLPVATNREVISTAFPDLFDPIQFLSSRLFGHARDSLSFDRAGEMLGRYGVNWVIVREGPWKEYFRKLHGAPEATLGPYEAFHVSREHSRFLVGTGEVHASVNRLELRNVGSPHDYVVLRYRYHPGWTCDPPSTVEPHPTDDGGGGLLLIRHPSPTTVLRFDTARALRTPWPAPDPSAAERP